MEAEEKELNTMKDGVPGPWCLGHSGCCKDPQMLADVVSQGFCYAARPEHSSTGCRVSMPATESFQKLFM